MMIYGYIRVSTQEQNVKNQEFEINNFAEKEGLKVDKWVVETISSRVELQKRKLGKLLKKLKQDDMVISSELSRLGRNLLEVMSILNTCMNKNVKVYTIKDNYRLGSDIQSKVLAFAFGIAAEIERDLISQRTRDALKRIKSEGKKLGRPVGFTFRKLEIHKDDIKSLLKKGKSKSYIAKKYGCTWSTTHKYIKEMNE